MSRGPLRQRIVCLSQRSSTSWESCEERERAVAIEQREVSKSGVVPAGCYFCHLARPSSVRLSFLLSSSEWTHSEGIVIIINLKLALCVVYYEYFNILIKILYVNACVGVAFTLLCAYICYFLVEELEIGCQRSQLLPCWKNASACSLSALFQSTVSVLHVQTHSLYRRENCQIIEIPYHAFTATLHPGRHTSAQFTLNGQWCPDCQAVAVSHFRVCILRRTRLLQGESFGEILLTASTVVRWGGLSFGVVPDCVTRCLTHDFCCPGPWQWWSMPHNVMSPFSLFPSNYLG